MISLFKRIALGGALTCMTLGLVDAATECRSKGPITIEKQHCLSCVPLLPRKGDQIIHNKNEVPCYYRTCELRLATLDRDENIRTTIAAVKQAINEAFDQCEGYATTNIDNVDYPDIAVNLYVGAYKNQPGNP
ncbi:secreted protein [Melampsora americana]|nr:secreted protein [Melampsora americana]